MRAILALLLVLFIGCGKQDVKASHNRHYDNALKATVAIYPNSHLLMPWRAPGSGTGVLLNSGFIITSKHVVDVNYDGFIDQFERTVRVRFFYPNRKTVDGRIVFDPVGAWRISNDFVFISISNPPHSPIKFMDLNKYQNFLPGDGLFAIGLSNGTEPPHLTRGLKSTNTNTKLDRAALSIYFGNSGGGIFSEETGELLGIATKVEVDSSPGAYELVPEWTEYESVANIKSVTTAYGVPFLTDVSPKSLASQNRDALTYAAVVIAAVYSIWFIIVIYWQRRAQNVES